MYHRGVYLSGRQPQKILIHEKPSSDYPGANQDHNHPCEDNPFSQVLKQLGARKRQNRYHSNKLGNEAAQVGASSS